MGRTAAASWGLPAVEVSEHVRPQKPTLAHCSAAVGLLCCVREKGFSYCPQSESSVAGPWAGWRGQRTPNGGPGISGYFPAPLWAGSGAKSGCGGVRGSKNWRRVRSNGFGSNGLEREPGCGLAMEPIADTFIAPVWRAGIRVRMLFELPNHLKFDGLPLGLVPVGNEHSPVPRSAGIRSAGPAPHRVAWKPQ